MTRQSSKFVALLALVIAISACGGSPTSPKVEVCNDPNAANYLGSLPCVPKPPAQVVDSVTMTGSSHPPNAILTRYSFDSEGKGSGEVLFVTTSFTLKPETVAEATALSGSWNFSPRVVVCLSQNGEKPKDWFASGLCFGQGKAESGNMQHTLFVESKTGITSTSGFWMAVQAVGVNANREREVKKEYFAQPVGYPLNWKD